MPCTTACVLLHRVFRMFFLKWRDRSCHWQAGDKAGILGEAAATANALLAGPPSMRVFAQNGRMTPFLLSRIGVALFCACAAFPPDAAAAGSPACTATAARPAGDVRIRHAIDEALRQHQLFGGQTIERNGGLFRVGHHEAEWSAWGEPAPPWKRVSQFWRSVSESEPPRLMTSLGWVARSEAAPEAATAGSEAGSRAQVATREALLRAAIVDTPWSAAFISYLMKTAGFSRAEFAFSDTHADYVRAALDTSAAEAAGRESSHAFRLCDVATTRPRAGDMLCATRAETAGLIRFEAVAAAIAERVAGQDFPMHCDIVVRSDEGGDAKLETVGGNVVQSVTLARMTLNARKVLSTSYISTAGPRQDCSGGAPRCRPHLGRRPWVMLLQFRH